MAECPCTNIYIMQLFHELKQKFPAVPDRIVSDCIKLNAHDKEACEAVLSKENQTYSFPGGRVCKMAADGTHEPQQRPDSLRLEDTEWDFDRRLLGRQSLDSLRCTRGAAHQVCKRFSEELSRQHGSDENLNVFSRLSIQDERWSSRQIHRECRSSELVTGNDDSCRCERTRVSVMSYGNHSAPVTPSNYPLPSFPPLTVDVTTQRHCTSLNLDPTPHYVGAPEPTRPYTSVNLTLRPPSSEPQPPIDIISNAGGLTYSSCSYDPRQGYQSQLKISIGPGGQGTVTAARTTTHRPALTPTSDVLTIPAKHQLSLPTKALVSEQLERKERLSQELNKYKERLCNMKLEARTMKSDLESRLRLPPISIKVETLREEIIMLQRECDCMINQVQRMEVRNINMATLPLGETNEEFYKNIYRGQLFPCRSSRQSVPLPISSTTAAEVQNWTCHVCTFHNHPALNKCEQCDMPRIISGSDTQNIHIRVTHHNVPSSPCRRMVHGWVV